MLDSPSLASIITTQVWKDRLLGQSRMLSLPNQALWLITGNNPVLSMELARRCIRIHMDAEIERAWRRQEFRHMPVTGWAIQHRSELIQAALVLGQAWIAAGKPLHPVRLGSFEQWSEVMGGILQVAGVPGFLGNLDDLYEAADAEGQMWREFVAQWWESLGLQPKRAADLLELCDQHDLMLKVRGDGPPRSQQTKLGSALHGARDRVFCDLRVTQHPDPRAKGRLYALAPVGRESHSGDDNACQGAEPAEPLPNLGPQGSAEEKPATSSLFLGDAEPAVPFPVPHARERGDDVARDTCDTRTHARGAQEGSEGTAGSEMQQKPSSFRAEPVPNLPRGSADDSPVDLADLPEEIEE
jgi:hypothetical protein